VVSYDVAYMFQYYIHVVSRTALSMFYLFNHIVSIYILCLFQSACLVSERIKMPKRGGELGFSKNLSNL